MAVRGRRGTWGVAGAVAVVSLVAGGGFAAAVIGGDVEPVVLLEPECPGQAPDEATAVALARECGHDVEVMDARTEWNTLVARPDSTMRFEVSAVAVRTEVTGQWSDIDTSIVATGDGFEVVAPVSPMRFSDGGGGPLASISREDHDLELDVPFDLPAPELTDQNQLTYVDVLPDVDLVVTVNGDGTGFSEVLRVGTPQAAADPRLRELVLPVEVSEDLSLEPYGAGFAAVSESGEAVFRSPAPQMWDSRPAAEAPVAPARTGLSRAMFAAEEPAVPAAEEGDRAVAPLGSEVIAAMATTVEDDAVTITPDVAVLDSPETVWPVYIDPQMDSSRNQWTAVRDVFSQKYMFGGDEGVGLCNRATSSTCDATFRSRLLWTFTGLQEIGDLDPNNVIEATFSAVGFHSYDCTPRAVTLYRVGDFTSATNWPGGTLWDPLSTQTVAHKSIDDCPSQPIRRIEWDATGQAQAIAQAGTAQGSLGLASDESSMAYWKRYRNDATFSVEYNHAPDMPSDVRATAGGIAVPCSGRPSIKTVTPTLRARVFDQDDDMVRAKFQIFNVASGALVYDPPWETYQASGALFSHEVPEGKLTSGKVYQYRVYAQDSYEWQTGPVMCDFVPDTTAPPPPTVTSVGGVYPENSWGGGAEVPGQFRLASTASDFNRFEYSIKVGRSTLVTEKTPAGQAVATVAFTPAMVGNYTLEVVALDLVGNVSTPKSYQFKVTFASMVGRWELDEESGRSAADTAGVQPPHPLAIGTATRTGGVLADRDPDSTDRALRFDALEDAAQTDGPVLRTDQAFSVSATVRLNSAGVGAPGTAVGADGFSASGFELGYRTTGCPNGLSGCWVFEMNTSDTPTATPVRAFADLPVTPGRWTNLIGVFTGSQLKVYACDLGTDTEPGLQEPVASTPVNLTKPFGAGGPLTVGRGQQAGEDARAWYGDVADVRAYLGAVDVADARMICQAPR